MISEGSDIQTKLSKDAISAVKQIVGYRSTPMEDRPQVEDMFQTSFGKTLGSQVGEHTRYRQTILDEYRHSFSWSIS